MLKSHRHFAAANGKLTKHAQEMEALQKHHTRVLQDANLRAATLIGSGVFERSSEGKLVVAEPYSQIITSKLAA